MHEHAKCKHQLKYCEHCDLVYCEECKREWKKEMTGWTYTSCTKGTAAYPLVTNCTHK